MSFLTSAPEFTSKQLYSGAGTTPMLEAAGAWEGLATELSLAANSFTTHIANVSSSAWQGPAAQAMAAASTPYTLWLDQASTQAAPPPPAPKQQPAPTKQPRRP